MVLAQGVPLSPSLQTRLIALVVVEALLITTAVLLYVLWARLKKRPLDEWWAGRKAEGFSPRVRAVMEESERERIAAEDAAPPAGGAARRRPVAGDARRESHDLIPPALCRDGVAGPPNGDNRFTTRDAVTDLDGRTKP